MREYTRRPGLGAGTLSWRRMQNAPFAMFLTGLGGFTAPLGVEWRTRQQAPRRFSLCMLSLNTLRYVKNYLSHLNPDEVQEMSDRPIRIGLVASGSDAYLDMEDWLLPPGMSNEKRAEGAALLHRAGDPEVAATLDLVLYEQGLPCPVGAFTFYRQSPETTVEEIIGERNDLSIPLAAGFLPFRRAVCLDVIHRVSRENALFTVATSIPFATPLLGIGASVAQFASETAFLTVNQIRMGFLLAAACDQRVGYGAQKAEIAGMIASGFGWRSLARQLAGKLRFAGGLIPKAGIAYAGTYVMGIALERFYSVGYGLSRAERQGAYSAALERGKATAQEFLSNLRRPQVA
jgi:hypothetical protein